MVKQKSYHTQSPAKCCKLLIGEFMGYLYDHNILCLVLRVFISLL